MAVMVGSARSSYGNASAGDQNGGKEVSTQAYYVHSKGWYVYRAKDAVQREKIAQAMEKACANNDIGYSQPTRNTLWNNVKDHGYDPSKTTKKVNTDCSALVRVCCAYAGIIVGDFITSNQGSKLMATGKFEKFTDKDHCSKSDYLMRGDILCTRTKGHTVVVLDNGAKSGAAAVPPKPVQPGERQLSRGDEGEDVKELQRMLIALGFSCGSYGADGDFGSGTQKAVKAYQTSKGLDADGIVGPKTWAALNRDLNEAGDAPETTPEAPAGKLKVKAGTWNLRTGPGTDYPIAEVVKGGDTLAEAQTDGWIPIVAAGELRWVSRKAIG